MKYLQKVIFNADDFGLSLGVCEAIDELIKLGAVGDTTVMMWAPDLIEYAKMYPYVFENNHAGVHLQLPGEIPFSNFEIGNPNCLINEESVKKEDILRLDGQLVYDEWNAQIRRFIQVFQQKPTHLDTHMGYHRSPEFRSVYLALAQKYNIPVRGGEDPFTSIMKSNNVKGTTRFVRGWSGRECPYGTLKAKLLELKKYCDPSQDVIEVTCHPGHVDGSLAERSHLTTGREHDYREILDIYQKNWLAKNGFELISFCDL